MHKSENLQIETQLNEIYRFDNLVKTDSNQDALSAGFFVSLKLGEKLFNPLFICGFPHFGKDFIFIVSIDCLQVI